MRLEMLLPFLQVVLVSGWVSLAPAQEPTGPKPAQPARPLALPTLRPPIADSGIFSPLALPPATEIRRPNGAPGKGYWQQQVDYAIRATLDTSTKRITASQIVRYANNSPDTLRFVWMQLDQNLFRAGSTGSLLFPPRGGASEAGFEGGFEIERVVQCTGAVGQPGTGAVKKRTRRRAARPAAPPPPCPAVTLRSRVEETMMYLDLGRPIPPGGTSVLELSFAFNVPENGANRMGRDGPLYQIAQWYPRMAVYDDVHGWNTSQYLGPGEFYLEYGNIEYEITVPAGYILAATGVLQNPAEVLPVSQQSRLAAASKSDSVTSIVTAEELATGAARPTSQGSLTWRFRANRVRDVAWAASPDYLWDATRWDGVVVSAFYRPSAADTWKDAAAMARHSVQEYSTRWLRYPYPQISVAEGPASGTAYPMIAMEARGDSAAGLYRSLTHEISHMWYPATVGSDERRYAWMDEGFATFINAFSVESYWKRDDGALRRQERQLVTRLDQATTAQPILTPANRYQNGNNLRSLASLKPAVMLLALRSKVLGAEVFDSAFREYTRRWAFKHPQPADFFRTMEEVSGRDLAWFWRGFFYTSASLDQAVETVKQTADGPAQILLASLGDAVMPVELELTFEDRSTTLVKLPVEIWYGGSRFLYEIQPGKPVIAARVNPDGGFPDAATTNDSWILPDQPRSSANERR